MVWGVTVIVTEPKSKSTTVRREEQVEKALDWPVAEQVLSDGGNDFDISGGKESGGKESGRKESWQTAQQPHRHEFIKRSVPTGQGDQRKDVTEEAVDLV